MKDILDSDYKTILIDENGSGILSVNREAWQNELYRLERISNFILIACFLMFLYIPFPGKFYAVIPAIIFMFYYRISYRARFKNLVMHGLYDYEIFDSKVVRYTDTNYRRFELADVKSVKRKKYGIVLYLSKGWRSLWLYHERPEVIVIPSKITGYDQIEQFFSELYNWKTKRLLKPV